MLRVGIVGCGDIFEHHRRAWSRLRAVDLVGVFDEDPRAAEESEVGSDLIAFAGLDELTAACDVVDICTPPDSHLTIALSAIESGCHLIIEKPVTLRLEEWDEIVQFADARGVKVAGLHNQKFFEVNQRARRWMVEGRIGRLLRVHDEFMVTEATDRMLGKEGHWSHSLPGGRWLEVLPHNLYLLHYLAGPHELAGVEVLLGSNGSPAKGVEELVVTLAGEGSLAAIHFSANCALDRRGMTLLGTEGVIEVVPPGRVATRSRIASNTLKKAVGLPFLDAASKLSQMVPDRLRFLAGRVGLSAHGRNIEQFVRHVAGTAENPTPRDEVTYTIRLAEQIGDEIQRRIEQFSPPDGSSRLRRPQAERVTGGHGMPIPNSQPDRSRGPTAGATSLPELRIFATSLPRFASDFSVIPNAWSARGGRVSLYAPSPGPEEHVWWADSDVVRRARARLSPDVEIRPLPFDRHRRDPAAAFRSLKLARTLSRGSPEDVFLFWAIPPSLLLGLPFRLRNRRCVFMLTGLGSIFGAHSGRLLRAAVAPALAYLLSGRSSRGVTHNHEDRQYFVRGYGIDPSHITVTGGCGIDPDEFPFGREWPVNHRPIVLVPVRLLEEKGVRDAAAASGILNERGVDHEMWFSSTFDTGNPHSLSESDVEALETRYRRVRFIGYQPHMAPVFRAADIVCVPTWYREGLPTALLEAAASGRPIVTTDNIGGREFIRDGRNGLLVPTRDARALADALERLVTDPELGERFRQEAFHDFQEGYTKDHMLRRVLDVVADLGVPLPPGPGSGVRHA